VDFKSNSIPVDFKPNSIPVNFKPNSISVDFKPNDKTSSDIYYELDFKFNSIS